ncbi:MAG: glycosyltransferase, partial [Pseudomonadota bacterium]
MTIDTSREAGSGAPAGTATDLPPAAVTPADYGRRRVLFTTLNLVSMGLLITAMAILLNTGGWHWTDMVMMGAFALTLPWLTIGFWNAVIGFGLTVFTRDPVAHVSPSLIVDDATPISSRTAIVMTVRNEDPDRALDRFRAVQQSIARTDAAELFAFHLLSDTDNPEIAAAEEVLVEQWRATTGPNVAIHYRRRESNIGFKAGNVMDFAEAWQGEYNFFIPLDADSLMSGDAIIRLVRRIEANSQIGILQGLVVGMPSDSAFARLFQFGMRHGMRAYTMGSAWWHGDCGPFWGHNAVVRMSSFVEHGEMPVLPGKAPLGGHILSHDQVEAALIRRGGYEVRVWPIE